MKFGTRDYIVDMCRIWSQYV